jgi:hypothetical protein
MGGNIGPGVGINFAPFRQVSSETYAFLVGYFDKYPSTSTALSYPGGFLMKMPLPLVPPATVTTATNICDTFTAVLGTDVTSLFQSNFVPGVATIPGSFASTHFDENSSFSDFGSDTSSVKTLVLSPTESRSQCAPVSSYTIVPSNVANQTFSTSNVTSGSYTVPSFTTNPGSSSTIVYSNIGTLPKGVTFTSSN